MMKTTVLALLMLPFIAKSQDAGVRFQHGLSWQQIKAKAKAENKYIFIDCMATWCAPCKGMEKFVFPKKEAGDFFNKHFISVKLQLDTTKKDNEEVKAWYADGSDIARQYGIRVFPTLLFFNPDGKAVHRIDGAVREPAELVKYGGYALDSNRQYYTLQEKYHNGNREPVVLRNTAEMLLNNDEKVPAARVYSEWIAAEANPLAPGNIDLIAKFTRSSEDPGFALLMENVGKIEDANTKKLANETLLNVIAMEEVMGKLAGVVGPQWGQMKKAILEKYPQMSPADIDEMMAEGKINYYKYAGDLQNYAPALMEYMDSFGDKANAEKLNNIAWDVVSSYPPDEKEYLTQALAWSKRTLKENNPAFMDTYATLLYQLGQKKEAIVYEQKAATLAKGAEKTTYQQTLAKMKKGEKILGARE